MGNRGTNSKRTFEEAHESSVEFIPGREVKRTPANLLLLSALSAQIVTCSDSLLLKKYWGRRHAAPVERVVSLVVKQGCALVLHNSLESFTTILRVPPNRQLSLRLI
jgi:hypothetical protein